MTTILIIIGSLTFLALSFAGGFYYHHRLQRKLDIACLKQAQEELDQEINISHQFDFHPGTFQYRPIISAFTNNAIDTVFIWHSDTEFGIGGAYTRDDTFTYDEYPLIIGYEVTDGQRFIELGEAIMEFGGKLEEQWQKQLNA